MSELNNRVRSRGRRNDGLNQGETELGYPRQQPANPPPTVHPPLPKTGSQLREEFIRRFTAKDWDFSDASHKNRRALVVGWLIPLP
jgi:hypothetical protein